MRTNFILTWISVSLLSLQAKSNSITTCAQSIETTEKAVSVQSKKASLLRDPREVWPQVVQLAHDMELHFDASKGILPPLFTAFIAHEFLWANGDPGGTKTKLLRVFIQSELDSITAERKKLFFQHMHPVLTESKFLGSQNIEKMIHEGRYELNFDNTLVSNDFVFLLLDEFAEASPAVQNLFHSIFNERKALLGFQVVDLNLFSGAVTSNKTLGQMVASSPEDRASLEASIDRIAVKIAVINQSADSDQRVLSRRRINWSQAHPLKQAGGFIHLAPLMDRVKIPQELLSAAVSIIDTLDTFYHQEALRAEEQGSDFVPPNQFSIRSTKKLVIKIWKATFLARQVMMGVEFDQIRWEMEPQDLADLAVGALLNGPGTIREKTVQVEVDVKDHQFESGDSFYYHRDEQGALNVRTGIINFTNIDNQPHYVRVDSTGQKLLGSSRIITDQGGVVDASRVIHPATLVRVEKLLSTPPPPGLEQDNTLQKYLKSKTLEEETRREFQFILQSRDVFINAANIAIQQLAGKPLTYQWNNHRAKQRRSEIEEQSLQILNTFRQLQEKRLDLGWADYYSFAAETVRQSFRELEFDFREMAHAIKAEMVAILSRNHVWLFGPPGGAKTALAIRIIEGVLKTLNETDIIYFENQVLRKYKEVLETISRENPEFQRFEVFFKQIHRMVSEKEISGHLKVDKQLQGKIEYNRDKSLAHSRFLFAVIDELHQGNSPLRQSLFSVLNEREVFAGHEAAKTFLVNAVITTNKVPFEMMKSVDQKEWPAMYALFSRIINKVFVANKLVGDQATLEYLKDSESGAIRDQGISPLMLLELQEWVDKVYIPVPLEALLWRVYEKFLADRNTIETADVEKFQQGEESDEYYMTATKASDRADNAIMDQFRASWLLAHILDGSFDLLLRQQEEQGRSWQDVRFEVSWRDVHLFSQGLAYWGPYEFKPRDDQNGFLNYDLDDSTLNRMLNSPVFSRRVKYQVRMIHDEAESFKTLLNTELRILIQQSRDRSALEASGADPAYGSILE